MEQDELYQYLLRLTQLAAVQTVMEEDEPLYYRLIKAFFKLTGVPMVLNTSFNTIKSEVRSLYLLYWYKSAALLQACKGVRQCLGCSTPRSTPSSRRCGTHFTCFTGTKVQILAPKKRAAYSGDPCRCRAVVSAYALCLLHWYKSTNTDSRKARSRLRRPPRRPCGRFSVALLVQQYRY